MGFLLAVLSFVVAEEVVELERVSAGDNKYKCNAITNPTDCYAEKYCDWYGSNSAGTQCIDDPCLAAGVQAVGVTSCPPQSLGGVTITCDLKTLPAAALKGDCTGGSGLFCGSQDNTAAYDYCFWANLRDGKCPDSVCEVDTATSRCIPTHFSQCSILSTKTECGLNPKCYWYDGNCYADPCWATGPITGANTCKGLNVIHPPNAGAASTDNCVDFKPLVGGEPLNYCVVKTNDKPNVCYFGTPGATLTPSSSVDYLATFPTYTSTRSPTCEGPISGTGCEGNGNCTTIVNVKGAFAGAYCTDGTHGDDAANILRIPSLLLLLALSLSLFAL